MILTGKAKEDFEEWYTERYNEYNVSYTDDTHLYAMIIDWLDTVGIYVSVSPVYPIEIYGWSWSINLNLIGQMFNPSRQEDTKAAIQQANLIYNEKNT